MNVLFIVVDDLKPDLGCYGNSVIYSPNINQLAKSSTLFQNAYCQQAICGPTRSSVLTGLRPDNTHIWDLKAKLRVENPDIRTLPQYFKDNGYFTIGMGKVFDPSNVDEGGDVLSWSVPFVKKFPLAEGFQNIAFGIYQSAFVKQSVKLSGDEDKEEQDFYGPNKDQKIRFSSECLDVPDNAYMDGAMADYAIAQLNLLSKVQQPFFMAVGFKKPHLPFVAPKKYWDLYKRDNIQLAPFREKALNSPDIAYHNSGELRSYSADIFPLNEKGNFLLLSEGKQRELINGYYACVSYIDAQIGKLTAELKKTGLDKNTIIVLLGDHGWHLGDHNLWCKHSNFEQATHAPLIIKVPGLTKGAKFNGLVEFVDIFPTICELAGIDINRKFDGKSLVPILSNATLLGKEYAISQYPRGAGDGPKETMGYSIRTDRYRYTEWIKGYTTTSKAFDSKDLLVAELYDYKVDPFETKNIVKENEQGEVVAVLSQKLHVYFDQQFKERKINN